MRSPWKIPLLAVVFIVLLRMCIGWQFFYEGIWKLQTLQTARPWTAAGYLKNSAGPFRPIFRDLAGDPDELGWLDYGRVAADWDLWAQEFGNHFALTDEQQTQLDRLLNGSPEFVAELEQLPEGVEFGSLGKIVSYDQKRKRLIVDGVQHLTPRERDQLLAMVSPDEDPAGQEHERAEQAKAFEKAVRDVYARAARLSFKERLAASLKGDPARAGVIDKEQEGTIDYKRLGEIELYRDQLARYEQSRAQIAETFQHEHAQRQFGELQQLRARLVGPVKALDAEFQEAAYDLLTNEQVAQGPVVIRRPIDTINTVTIWSLIVLGLLLIAGLFSRVAALGAAVLLLSFYLAMPPWPGVVEFQELPGPEHSFIVDKNLIEVCALLAITCLPTGSWFGLDALFAGWLARRRTARPTESREFEPVGARTARA